ncbi:hypothetical protein SteCoe_25243 [Stentor coeruleus]|uniref:Membrane transporter protein n=1 Tax=Stentor coeruleus TaxID=5963 RepID=A0A1R2BFM5_9CILI|nr:hypothetical protein SteCoe_25243 [Stentor coeruleus]
MVNILLLFLLLTCAFGDGASSSSAEKCTIDSDCLPYNSCHNELCAHKEIFQLEGLEWVGSVILLIVSIIANAGGVGGSVICTSLLLLLFYFNPHQAVALTQSFVFAGSFTSVALKIKDRHPTRNRPLIYYDMLMQLCSPLLLGVSIGVMVNPGFPGWLILAMLTLAVFYLGINGFIKAASLYKIESQAKALKEKQNADAEKEQEINKNIAEEFKHQHSESDANLKINKAEKNFEGNHNDFSQNNSADSERNSLDSLSNASKNQKETPKDTNTKGFVDDKKNVDYKDISSELQEKINKIHKSEEKIISLFHLIYFVLLALFSILFTLLKGSNSYKSIIGISSCSVGFGMVIIGYVISMLLLSLYSSVYLVRKTKICESANYNFEVGDIHWYPKKCIIFIIAGFITGILVGILGLSAGYIIGSILLFLKVRPEITTTSTSFTITITSFTAMIQFFIEGIIDWKYALWLMGASSLGALVGILVLRKQVVKRGRSSILIYGFSAILAGSFIIIPTVGIINTLKQVDKGTFIIGFKNIC